MFSAKRLITPVFYPALGPSQIVRQFVRCALHSSTTYAPQLGKSVWNEGQFSGFGNRRRHMEPWRAEIAVAHETARSSRDSTNAQPWVLKYPALACFFKAQPGEVTELTNSAFCCSRAANEAKASLTAISSSSGLGAAILTSSISSCCRHAPPRLASCGRGQ